MTAIRAIGILLGSLALIGVAEAQKGGGKVKYAVSVTVNGSGTVVSNTGGISCPGTCSTTVNSGTNVSLTAIPDSGANFLGWDGDCAIYGSDPICTLTVSADTNATANFDNGNNPPTPYSPVVIDVACDGTGTKLQDALNALNPVANVYEVRVSGVCPESLRIYGFIALTIVSTHANETASIGQLTVGGDEFSSSAPNSFVQLRNINVIATATVGTAAIYVRPSNTVVHLKNINVICSYQSCNNYLLAAYDGAGVKIDTLNSLGIDSPQVLLYRSVARIALYAEPNLGVCSPISIVLKEGSTARVDNWACAEINYAASWGSKLTILDAVSCPNINVLSSQAYVFPGGCDQASWSVTCRGISEVTNSSGDTNLCVTAQ